MKKRGLHLGLWLFFTFASIVELIVSIILGLGASYALNYIFGISEYV